MTYLMNERFQSLNKRLSDHHDLNVRMLLDESKVFESRIEGFLNRVCMLIGSKCVGKTTLISYLKGIPLEYTGDRKIVIRDGHEGVEGAVIGHTTMFPCPHHKQLTVIDSPGFGVKRDLDGAMSLGLSRVMTAIDNEIDSLWYVLKASRVQEMNTEYALEIYNDVANNLSGGGLDAKGVWETYRVNFIVLIDAEGHDDDDILRTRIRLLERQPHESEEAYNERIGEPDVAVVYRYLRERCHFIDVLAEDQGAGRASLLDAMASDDDCVAIPSNAFLLQIPESLLQCVFEYWEIVVHEAKFCRDIVCGDGGGEFSLLSVMHKMQEIERRMHEAEQARAEFEQWEAEEAETEINIQMLVTQIEEWCSLYDDYIVKYKRMRQEQERCERDREEINQLTQDIVDSAHSEKPFDIPDGKLKYTELKGTSDCSHHWFGYFKCKPEDIVLRVSFLLYPVRVVTIVEQRNCSLVTRNEDVIGKLEDVSLQFQCDKVEDACVRVRLQTYEKDVPDLAEEKVRRRSILEADHPTRQIEATKHADVFGVAREKLANFCIEHKGSQYESADKAKDQIQSYRCRLDELKRLKSMREKDMQHHHEWVEERRGVLRRWLDDHARNSIVAFKGNLLDLIPNLHMSLFVINNREVAHLLCKLREHICDMKEVLDMGSMFVADKLPRRHADLYIEKLDIALDALQTHSESVRMRVLDADHQQLACVMSTAFAGCVWRVTPANQIPIVFLLSVLCCLPTWKNGRHWHRSVVFARKHVWVRVIVALVYAVFALFILWSREQPSDSITREMDTTVHNDEL